jgi:glycosyltransferase involved in cell wall biosynthesis
MGVRSACVFVVPGRLETRTGGYEYDRRVIAAMRTLGWTVDVAELAAEFPNPTRAALLDVSSVLSAIADGTVVVVDGLAFGAMPEQAAREAHRLRFVALVHMPLAAAIGLDHETAARYEASERRALGFAAGVVVTGRSTVAAVRALGVPSERIALVEPGTDPAPIARGSGDQTTHLVCIAALTRGKGHLQLVEALAHVASRGWRLTCAGSLDRDPEAAERVRSAILAHGLEEHVTLAGELGAGGVADLLDRADAFVFATLGETYGMAVAEALARGLPIVSTRTGGIPELVGAGDSAAGLLVEPGDVEGLGAALTHVIADASARRRFADNARVARNRLPTWDDAGRAMARALDRFTRYSADVVSP